jgi:A/G-specific adenine glycosylase
MSDIKKFKKIISSHYKKHRRDMPWRRDFSPYYVVVSEIMLQQTQVSRVIPKFESWIKRFPDWKALAKAPVASVLKEWSGLGYNRRALYLKRIAEKITSLPEYADLRRSPLRTRPRIDLGRILKSLPGIGPNTAGAIRAYAFNQPAVFIETNIRSIFIHHFFKGSKKKVSDEKLMPLIEKTLDKKRCREWYWALMDYGSHLKSVQVNPSRKSAHHVRQSTFKGSNRELRSNILKEILREPQTESALKKKFYAASTTKNLRDLVSEGFIVKSGARYQIA